ncbi:MAG: T9SS type A sorting domain-containing protein [Candidatus Eisenbacteria bacterium]|nr:T9SS type A sorting domain-containing protein [Candidatus Eisenbacteria bacterium]
MRTEHFPNCSFREHHAHRPLWTRRHREALLVVVLVVGTLLVRGGWAQTAMPEQRLSTSISTRYHDPQLVAQGQGAFGAWGGADAYPNNVSYGISMDRGVTWTNEWVLPLAIPPYWGAQVPLAIATGQGGAVHLLVDNIGHFYYRRPALDVPSWTPAVSCGYEGGDYDRPDDLPVIGADPLGERVYTTFTRCNAPYQSTIWFLRSLNSGATWSSHLDLSSPNCNGSSLVVGPDGSLYVTWVDYALGQVLMRRSADLGATFSPPSVVTSMLDNLATTPVGWNVPFGMGLRSYPYYREGLVRGAPNFPTLAIDRSNNPSRGTLYLAWAEHAEGTPAPATVTHVDTELNDTPANAQMVTLDSNISGSLWSGGHTGPVDRDWFAFDGAAGQTIQLDGDSPSVYGKGCQLLEQLPDGSLLSLAWLLMLGNRDLENGAHGKAPVVTLPRTGRYLLSLTGSTIEAPYYFLRLRTWQVAPGSVARDMRDIVLIRSTDGGVTWSPRVRVNHDPAGADQHQPNVAVDGQGRVYVAWYDRRGSAFGNEVRPYAAVSVDGGASFGPDLPLRAGFNPWDGSQSAELIGDRIALAAGDDFGMVAWTDFRDWPNRCDIYGARIVDVPTAVAAVSDLAAEPVAAGVRLHWRVNDLQGLSGLVVLRSEGSGSEEAVGSVTLAGGASEAEYVDAGVEPGREYRYRLRFTWNGEVLHLGPVDVRTPARISTLEWRASGPNPFTARTTVTLALPRAEAALVRVYDVQGKVVRTLHDEWLEAGERRLEWDGRDTAGTDVAPGLYFVSAQAGGGSVTTRLTRVR